MRLYTFINMYLSHIQAGIQTAHILGELHNKADFNTIVTRSDEDHGNECNVVYTKRSLMTKEYSQDHKTIVVCNGGNGASIRDYIKFFDSSENPYPWATFHEDEDSLDGALTGVGIVLPEDIYEVDVTFENLKTSEGLERVKVFTNKITGKRFDFPESYTYQLINKIKSAPLFR